MVRELKKMNPKSTFLAVSFKRVEEKEENLNGLIAKAHNFVMKVSSTLQTNLMGMDN